ncbi:hypothetical protein N7510_007279 [Penicillium lagena]|uniref:uncharacterized protein n=1 Tax=Penicillium lagena TaxID=94218 RepID=UPI002542267C|nr:uncharacterized protein N7510_007279 [Penicillium lagena]KAJ5610560.1 hypothetical protein N7510_007279 [Penicillium lagena]
MSHHPSSAVHLSLGADWQRLRCNVLRDSSSMYPRLQSPAAGRFLDHADFSCDGRAPSPLAHHICRKAGGH